MKTGLVLLLLFLPYLLFWAFWWRYAKHYLESFRIPGPSELRQAWEWSYAVSYGATARRVVVVFLVTFYAILLPAIVANL